MLFDFAISDTPDLEAGVRSLWTGRHAASPSPDSHSHLAQTVADGGGSSTLITDESRVAAMDSAAHFDRTVELQIRPATAPARDATETRLSDFFAQTIPELARVASGDLLWLHSSGLAGPWDAPMDLRQQWVDEDDPDPPGLFDSPDLKFDPTVDSPDLLLGYQQTCAAQIFILDQFLGLLFDQIQSLDNLKSSLLLITSTRSTANGEHGRIGTPHDLHNESLHVPLLVYDPIATIESSRSLQLVQPACVNKILNNCFCEKETTALIGPPESDPTTDRIAVSIYEDLRSIQTPKWKLIRDADRQCKLYVKPDDRWEVNDVFTRCRHIAAALEDVLDECLQLLASGHSIAEVEIPEELDVRV